MLARLSFRQRCASHVKRAAAVQKSKLDVMTVAGVIGVILAAAPALRVSIGLLLGSAESLLSARVASHSMPCPVEGQHNKLHPIY